MKFKIIAILFLIPISINAQTLNQFQGGSPISASEINQNFNTLLGMFNTNGVEGMMSCTQVGVSTDTRELVFGSCASTADTVLEEISEINVFGSQYNATFKNALSMQKMFEEKWVLANTILFGTGNTDEEHLFIFYKAKSE
jgi:hypothetical protein